ncbi:MAG: class I SAM-dependent methyltransferase [Egibacteraceae bacterium]
MSEGERSRSSVAVPDAARARAFVAPDVELDERIRTFLRAQLGGVLPADDARGLGWYHDFVVLESRALEAFAVFARHGGGAHGKPVLDIGSGLGSFVLLANGFGLPAIGIEPGVQEYELALERQAALPQFAERELFRTGVGEALPYEDESVSGVLLHDVLEHVGDWRAVLREAHRVVAPEGVLYVKGPNYSVRLIEPHYRVPWLPMMPKNIARPYLRALGRDIGYLDHLGYRQRGAVLRELRGLGLELTFPRQVKLRDPESINRPLARVLTAPLRMGGPFGRLGDIVAENPLQWAIDVVARRPRG